MLIISMSAGSQLFHIRIGNLRLPENRPNSRRVRDVIEIYVDIAAAIDIIVELTLVDIDTRVAQTPIISVKAAAAGMSEKKIVGDFVALYSKAVSGGSL